MVWTQRHDKNDHNGPQLDMLYNHIIGTPEKLIVALTNQASQLLMLQTT